MWAGVDVGGRRKGFHVAVVAERGLVEDPVQIRTVADVVAFLLAQRPLVVAVDSPRSAAPNGLRSRPCERELARAVCGIRYTPERALLEGNTYYEWIGNGLDLYRALGREEWAVIECFPTASFTRWAGPRQAKTRAAWSRDCLGVFGFGPLGHGQDGRDAVAAALTARCYSNGLYEEFGEIVVPVAGSGDQNSSRFPSGS